jgi:hypothetical protein
MINSHLFVQYYPFDALPVGVGTVMPSSLGEGGVRMVIKTRRTSTAGRAAVA